MTKDIADMLRQSLEDAHTTLEGTMTGVTNKVAHFQPGGKAISIAAVYVHAIVSEDVLVNSWARKEKPLLEKWAKKMGVSAPHPNMDQNWEKNYTKWAKTVKVDLTKFREYGKVVYKSSDTYLASLTDNDLLGIKLDLSAVGEKEKWPIGRFIIRFLISHVDSITGEISAIKGIQGLKGYPF